MELCKRAAEGAAEGEPPAAAAALARLVDAALVADDIDGDAWPFAPATPPPAPATASKSLAWLVLSGSLGEQLVYHPPFSQDTQNYSLSVGSTTQDVELLATGVRDAHQVSVRGGKNPNGDTEPLSSTHLRTMEEERAGLRPSVSHSAPLEYGTNLFSVSVISAIHTEHYHLSILRKVKPTSVYLQLLNVTAPEPVAEENTGEGEGDGGESVEAEYMLCAVAPCTQTTLVFDLHEGAESFRVRPMSSSCLLYTSDAADE